MTRSATAQWNGALKDGNGTMSSSSGALRDLPYSFRTRFEDEPGTNPEELIAAAHAGCFSMAFSGKLNAAGLSPEFIRTTADLTLEKTDAGQTITAIHLTTRARVPGADAAAFEAAAQDAKATCPISRLLNTEITVDAALE
jgi:osmotically inducible protein OsmC